MQFNSLDYMIFFPIVLIVYFLIPDRVKYLWLLGASYYFYMCWNPLYVLLILASTIITYASGLLLERIKHSDNDELRRRQLKKIVVAVSIISNLGILFYFKYFGYGMELISDVFKRLNISVNVPAFDIMLPVGISFYTFQALSYTIDVYRDEIYAEKNFLRYALFVSFFPQLVAGPIERSKNLMKQLAVPHKFSVDNFREGLLLILWGLFQKIVIADRIATFVDVVYANYTTYQGAYLIVATVLFAFQIYCDFAGYSTIAMGSAKILGISLMENFDAPYLAVSVSDFWRRWHISLTSWFRDYLYIPLGGNRKGKIRKYLNIMVVFLVSGLWHGAKLSFVVWGGLNGLYQVIGDWLRPAKEKLSQKLHLNTNSLGHKIVSAFVTFVLVDFTWIFFRARSITGALRIIKNMITVFNPWVLFDGSMFECGVDEKNFHLAVISIVLLLIVDCFRKKKVRIREVIARQDTWFRYASIVFFILFLLVFGKYGPAYNAANFIYFQF